MTGRGETAADSPSKPACRQLLMRTRRGWRQPANPGSPPFPPVLGWLSHRRLHILELHTFSYVLRGGLDPGRTSPGGCRLQNERFRCVCVWQGGVGGGCSCVALQLKLSISCHWPVASSGPWSIPLQAVYQQSCLLWPEGNKHGNPRWLCLPRATLVNERAQQMAGSCVPTFLLLVGESCAAISVASASWPLPTFSVHTKAARNWAKEEASSAVLRAALPGVRL